MRTISCYSSLPDWDLTIWELQSWVATDLSNIEDMPRESWKMRMGAWHDWSPELIPGLFILAFYYTWNYNLTSRPIQKNFISIREYLICCMRLIVPISWWSKEWSLESEAIGRLFIFISHNMGKTWEQSSTNHIQQKSKVGRHSLSF